MSATSALESWVLKHSIFPFSLSVPGGATRLTESPIVKFALSDLSCGVAAGPLSSHWESFSDARVGSASLSNQPSKHLLAAGWLNCEISASYHNRRLVTWEPFVEPWRFEIVLGSDLSRAAKLHPVLDKRVKKLPLKEEPTYTTHSSPLRGSGRLRDIGRLLRSPFQIDNSTVKDTSVALLGSLDSDVDFCYLVLMAIAMNNIRAALHSSASSDRPPSITTLPNHHTIRWLNHFGYPMHADSDSKEIAQSPMIVCRVSDSVRLNINITGALIENLSEHLHKPAEDRSEHLAPHWIRNDSGLVSSDMLLIVSSTFALLTSTINTCIYYYSSDTLLSGSPGS